LHLKKKNGIWEIAGLYKVAHVGRTAPPLMMAYTSHCTVHAKPFGNIRYDIDGS
jgi:hypothetical protein